MKKIKMFNILKPCMIACIVMGTIVFLIVAIMNGSTFTITANEIVNEKSEHIDNLDHQVKSANGLETLGTDVQPLSTAPAHPSSGTIGANSGVVSNRKLISNSDFFSNGPMHGKNSGNSCGAVAAQLLLTYHNYYSDRRIIAPEYLHGGWKSNGNGNIFDASNYTNSEDNPNACVNPTNKTNKTTGSNQVFHDFIKNNYIHGNAMIMKVSSGMEKFLNEGIMLSAQLLNLVHGITICLGYLKFQLMVQWLR